MEKRNTLSQQNFISSQLEDLSTENRCRKMAGSEILAAAVIEVFLSVFGTFGNCLVCLVVMRKRNLQVATNYLLVSLAISDLLVSAILVPMRAAQHLAFPSGGKTARAAVEVAGFIGRVNIVASMLNLTVLTIDRCIALRNPIQYRTTIRYASQRVFRVILCVWTFAILLTSLPKIPGVPDAAFMIGFVVFVLMITAVIVGVHVNIFLVIHRSSQWRRSQQRHSVSSTFTGSSSNRSNDSRNDSRAPGKNSNDSQTNERCDTSFRNESPAQREIHRDHRIAKTIAIIIGIFILLVFPRISLIMYHFIVPESQASRLARLWIRVLLYTNSSVNPVLYFWRHGEFRREFLGVVLPWARTRRRQKRRRGHIPNT